MDVEVRAARAGDIPPIAAAAREADRAELWASHRETPAETLAKGLELSTRAWTVLFDGEPVAMGGVAPISVLGSMGAPWLVASSRVEDNPRGFLRISRGYVAEMSRLYSHLVNFVDQRNTVAIRYLAWLGFVMGEAVPYGVDGLAFLRFEMRAD